MDNYFIDFPQTGQLAIEKTFFSSYYPILFTCRSDSGALYLCVCCLADEGVKKWLLSETKSEIIIEMLTDKITLREAFLKGGKGKYTVCCNQDGQYSICASSSAWHAEDSTLLPTAGEYIEADENEFVEEITFYQAMLIHSDSCVA
ncbi:MAG: hypothetical protein FWG87_13760 [Defluviitaleaceae bacterium]|nr:hypothetical protein [Defluviitaleaceae bacterium]